MKSKAETVRPPKRSKKKKRHNNQAVATNDTHMSPKQLQLQHQHQLRASGQSNAASPVMMETAAMTTTTMTTMTPKQALAPTINVVWNQDLFRKMNETVAPSLPPQIISAKSSALFTPDNHKYMADNVMVYQLCAETVPQTMSKIKIQNIVAMGENSSAYESSEDTGVGELSESELITAQDGIGRLIVLLLNTSVLLHVYVHSTFINNFQ